MFDYDRLEEAEGPFTLYYQDGNGIQHEDYEAACRYYGADSPESLKGEEKWQEQQDREFEELLMDRMMAGEVQPAAWWGPVQPVWEF